MSKGERMWLRKELSRGGNSSCDVIRRTFEGELVSDTMDRIIDKGNIFRESAIRSTVWVIIPAYNEASVLGDVLHSLLANTDYTILLVDDGSTDNTTAIAATFPIFTIRHPKKRGTGAALQTGFDVAFENRADCVVTFDADGQHRVEDISPLVSRIRDDGFDIALGSRFLTAESRREVPLFRRSLLYCAVFFTRRLTELDISDTHNGLRAIRGGILGRFRLQHAGMAHASEILTLTAELDLHYVEVPVTVLYTAYSRRKGQGLLNFLIILWDLLFVKRKPGVKEVQQ